MTLYNLKSEVMEAKQTKLERKSRKSLTKLSRYFLIVMFFPFILNSCYIEIVETGYDGRPGDAYISLDWDYSSPDYLDAGTSDIPIHFEYGRDYLTYPGYYELYYEGEFWDGYDIAFYAWEIEYEIWRNEGTSGYPNGVDGFDGLDSYLTIILSPYGPFSYRLNKSTENSIYSFIEETEDKIIVEQSSEEYSIRITYKKVVKK